MEIILTYRQIETKKEYLQKRLIDSYSNEIFVAVRNFAHYNAPKSYEVKKGRTKL